MKTASSSEKPITALPINFRPSILRFCLFLPKYCLSRTFFFHSHHQFFLSVENFFTRMYIQCHLRTGVIGDSVFFFSAPYIFFQKSSLYLFLLSLFFSSYHHISPCTVFFLSHCSFILLCDINYASQETKICHATHKCSMQMLP